jgi:hypothetical protein
VTVVPTGYMDDVGALDFATASAAVAAYEKNGFSDYVMISPDEILAIMASADLRTKTGTLIGSDYWTNQTNIEETEAMAWVGEAGSIEAVPVDNTYYYIPVRRVTVV